MTGRRIDGAGTWVDRAHPIDFTIDGRLLQGTNAAAGESGNTGTSASLLR